MANEEHLKILKQGLEQWNKWRLENANKPDLSGSALCSANLNGADLSGADLSSANLRRSLGPPTTAIAERVRHVASSMASEFSNNDLKLLRCCIDTSSPSNQAFKAFSSKPSAWDDQLCMRFVRLLERDLIKSTGPTEVEATRKGQLLSAATLRA